MHIRRTTAFFTSLCPLELCNLRFGSASGSGRAGDRSLISKRLSMAPSESRSCFISSYIRCSMILVLRPGHFCHFASEQVRAFLSTFLWSEELETLGRHSHFALRPQIYSIFHFFRF